MRERVSLGVEDQEEVCEFRLKFRASEYQMSCDLRLGKESEKEKVNELLDNIRQ